MKNLVHFLGSVCFVLASVSAFAQSNNLPFGNPAYHWMDRLEIKSGKMASFHTVHKPYSREDITRFALSLDSAVQNGTLELSDQDWEDLKYIYRDNNLELGETAFESLSHPKYETREKPFLKHLYKTPANAFQQVGKDFSAVYQPTMSIDFGQENTESGNSPYFQRSYGVILRGDISNKVSYYTNALFYFDRYQAHVRKYIEKNKAVPGHGLYDRFTFGSIDSLYDNLNAEGYIDLKATKNIKVQFGHGKNFIGNGVRSLFLSDFSHNYLYLKLNTKVWKFDYQNIFAELREFSANQTTTSGTIANGLYKKYMASHHLSLNITDNFNVGLYEATIMARKTGFDPNYLNPIIFYRAVEHSLDSPDNALIGADFKWNVAKRFSFYGQVMLDELQLGNLFSNPDTWAHKFGGQLGVKYIDALNIDHLDLQIEANAVRPYSYSHFDSSTTYSHYSQPLAHPLGANFKELFFIVKYQPNSRLFLEMRTMFANMGRDTANTNWGSNIYESYRTRTADDGVFIGQGVNTNIFLLNFSASYMLFHNCFADLNVMYRKENSVIDSYDYNSFFISGGIRVNLWKPKLEF